MALHLIFMQVKAQRALADEAAVEQERLKQEVTALNDEVKRMHDASVKCKEDQSKAERYKKTAASSARGSEWREKMAEEQGMRGMEELLKKCGDVINKQEEELEQLKAERDLAQEEILKRKDEQKRSKIAEVGARGSNWREKMDEDRDATEMERLLRKCSQQITKQEDELEQVRTERDEALRCCRFLQNRASESGRKQEESPKSSLDRFKLRHDRIVEGVRKNRVDTLDLPTEGGNEDGDSDGDKMNTAMKQLKAARSSLEALKDVTMQQQICNTNWECALQALGIRLGHDK